MSTGKGEFLRTIERLQQRPAAAPEANPIQKALDDYDLMEDELGRAMERARNSEAREAALLAEVNMLREQVERSDHDRIRLQAISSTLLGRLLAINDCIAGAVRASIKDGIEATAEMKADPELEQAAQDVAAVLQRVQPLTPIPPPTAQASPRPPVVEWKR